MSFFPHSPLVTWHQPSPKLPGNLFKIHPFCLPSSPLASLSSSPSPICPPTPLLSLRPAAGEGARRGPRSSTHTSRRGRRQPSRLGPRGEIETKFNLPLKKLSFPPSLPLSFTVDLCCSRQPDVYISTVNAPAAVVSGFMRDNRIRIKYLAYLEHNGW